MATPLHVEIWSDVVCPWCFIGKRRFERAVEQLRGEIDVDVVYRPHQLDPTAPLGSPTPVADVYARKFGGHERAAAIIDHVTGVAADEGLEFHLDRAWRANTMAAHRLLWYTERRSHDLQAALKERLLAAYFTDGLDIGDLTVLADRAADAGLDRDEVVAFLESDAGAGEVTDMISSGRDRGITAVPTYVIDDAWAIPGAQDPDTFVQVLRRMAERRAAAASSTDDG